LGVQMIFVRMGSSDEFAGAFAAMMQERPDAFTMTGDPFHQLHVPWILDFLARHRLPAMYQLRENVLAGGLMSYGASQPDLFRRATGYVHKILQGTKPADLPVEQPVKFDLVVNLRTAKGTRLDDARILLAARRRGNRIEVVFMAHRVNAYEAAAANTLRDSTSMSCVIARR
jgi:putative tryptophan/tyrosine transport system substrate-binding protein